MTSHSATHSPQPSISHAPQRVKLVKNPNYVANGTKSLGHMLRKFCIMPTLETPFLVIDELVHPEHRSLLKRMLHRGQKHTVVQRRLMKLSADGQTGEVTAEDIQNDTEYLAQVAVGTPPQTFNLDFDTGSADLWLWSTEMPKKSQAEGKLNHHNFFDPTKSQTFKLSPSQTWNISYGDGSSASGNVGTDDVSIGGIVVKNQGIELASKMSPEFAQGTGDGLLGLAWGSINTVQPVQVKTPVENMIAQSDIASSAELFTAHLASARESTDTSFYTFGFIDPDVVAGGTIHYTPVDTSNGFWQFSSTSCTVNGKVYGRHGNTAIADTGTTLALIDDQTCRHIYAAIPGAKYSYDQGGYIFPTNSTSLPTIQMDVGGQMFAINKEDLAFADAGNGMSFGGVQSRGDLTFDILGDTFLKAIYAIFDVGNARFGALQRGSAQAPAPSQPTPTGQCPSAEAAKAVAPTLPASPTPAPTNNAGLAPPQAAVLPSSAPPAATAGAAPPAATSPAPTAANVPAPSSVSPTPATAAPATSPPAPLTSSTSGPAGPSAPTMAPAPVAAVGGK